MAEYISGYYKLVVLTLSTMFYAYPTLNIYLFILINREMWNGKFLKVIIAFNERNHSNLHFKKKLELLKYILLVSCCLIVHTRVFFKLFSFVKQQQQKNLQCLQQQTRD